MPLPPLEKRLVQTLRRSLLRWFDTSKRDLPWRRTQDPYAIWLSEIMLQQTQVATVIPYWERFLKHFPTVEALAQAPLEDVLSMWQGLGYYTRARSLHQAAQQVVKDFGGKLPPSVENLMKLPGFGRYTAGAVASIAFGQAAPIVDGNVARVLSRIFVVEGAVGDKEREKTLWNLAEQLVPRDRPGDFNQALMELGAKVCRVDAPTCLLCPVRNVCGALQQGRVQDLPPPKIRAARKPLHLAVAVWRRGESILLARRGTDGLFGGLWELPSAEFKGEAPENVLRQTLHPSLKVGSFLGRVDRTLTHRDLSLHLHEVSGPQLPKPTELYEEFRFVAPSTLKDVGMSTAMRQALEHVVGDKASLKKNAEPKVTS